MLIFCPCCGYHIDPQKIKTAVPSHQVLISVMEAITTVYGITEKQMKGKDRYAGIVEARHAFAYVVRQIFPQITLKEIGEFIGGRHHTTIMNNSAAAMESVFLWEKRKNRSAKEKYDKIMKAYNIVMEEYNINMAA